MVFLPEKEYATEIGPGQLLLELNDDTRFVSTDQVAHYLVEADPQVQLVDVRPAEEFEKFSLPGAINIPLDSLLKPNFEIYLDQIGISSIFYSNGTVYASQAWMLYRRKAFSNIYILKGGLNRWVETILRPQKPLSTASQDAFDLYETRLAASRFFGGGSVVEPQSSVKGVKPVIRRKKKKQAEGGCQ